MTQPPDRRSPPGNDSPPEGLDLARWLIPVPQRCLLLRVHGDSMQGAGIHHGDLLVVERVHPALSGAIVVARLGARFTLKRLRRQGERQWLEAAHPAYGAIDLERCGRGFRIVSHASTGTVSVITPKCSSTAI